MRFGDRQKSWKIIAILFCAYRSEEGGATILAADHRVWPAGSGKAMLVVSGRKLVEQAA